MIKRFEGTDGHRRLVTALRSHKMVQNDERLAERLATAAQLRQFSIGQVLAEQDSTDNSIYLIVSGSISIFVNGREMAVRNTNNHVGEMALIEPTERRSATLHAIEETVVAEISERDFTQIAEDYPELWRRLALEIAHRLRERSKHVKPPNSIPEVFIGCSVEKLEEARQIQNALSYDKIITRLWTDNVFGASSFTIDSLLEQVTRSDFAVLFLGSEDVVTSRRAKSVAPRDNVVFELGMFMGALGKERTLIVMEQGKDTKIPTDLMGLTPIQYQSGTADTIAPRLGSASNQIRTIIKNLGPK